MATDPSRRTPHGISRALLLVAVLMIASSACGDGGGEPQAARSPVPAANATTAALLPTDAQELPPMTFAQYEQLLGQLEGTPVVVNIWGSWCGPCREEAADLAAAAETYGDRVQFLGVDILDAPESARIFMDEFDWTYPSIHDPSPGGDIRNQLGYLGQPVTIFYDAAGELVDDWEGPIPPEELDRQLRRLISAP